MRPITFKVRADREVGALGRLWCSTGFTPASLLLDPAMRQALAWYGAVPEQGIRKVRIHFLLDLVVAKGLDSGAPSYDWSRLDAGLDALVANGLEPLFEMMGNPAGVEARRTPGQWPTFGDKLTWGWSTFADMTQPRTAAVWRRMCGDVGWHLIERYGRDRVRRWDFETWNEPDVGWWPQSIPAFLAYAEATARGLRDADPGLRFGGPGTCLTLSDTFKAFVRHFDETGLRLDFISVHEKGALWSKEDIPIDTVGLVEKTHLAIEYVRRHHPSLAAVPFMNNECDPIIGWKDIHTYHAKPWYAAWALRVVDQNLRRLVDGAGADVALVGNDHGFVGTWGQRTLLTCLTRGDDDCAQGHFLHVKKPVYNAAVAMALLGDRRLESAARSEHSALIATRCREGYAIAYGQVSDRTDHGGWSTPARLDVTGVPDGEYRVVHYRIDEGRPYPFDLWTQHSLSNVIDAALRTRMLDHAELGRVGEPTTAAIKGGRWSTRFDLPMPSMGLVLLLRKPRLRPAAVAGLAAARWPGLGEHEHVFLRWDPMPARRLRTYEVECNADGRWSRVNAPDTLCSAWAHLRAPLAHGARYRVRAVDLWSRPGPWSRVAQA